MTKVVVSVIILAYNHEDYIENAFESVASQNTRHYYEIIVSDDASTDATLGNVVKLKEKRKNGNFDIKVIEHIKNVGTTRNLCDAIEVAQGDFITILAGDDYWCNSNRMENQINWLISNPQYLGVCNSYQILKGNRLIKSCVAKNRLNRQIKISEALKGGGFLSHSTMFRNVFKDEAKRKKYFDHITMSKYIEDISLSMILFDLGNFYVLPGDVAVYRVRKLGRNYNSRTDNFNVYCEHIDNILENDSYFNERYDFSRLALMRTVTALSKALTKFDFKGVRKIWGKFPKKYKKKVFIEFIPTMYIFARYKIRGYF